MVDVRLTHSSLTPTPSFPITVDITPHLLFTHCAHTHTLTSTFLENSYNVIDSNRKVQRRHNKAHTMVEKDFMFCNVNHGFVHSS
jgi:hypothetical protein